MIYYIDATEDVKPVVATEYYSYTTPKVSHYDIYRIKKSKPTYDIYTIKKTKRNCILDLLF